MERTTEPNYSRLTTLVTIAIAVLGLFAGRDVLVPLALAVLFSFLLAPLVVRIQRFVGRVAAVLISVGLAAIILGLVGIFVGSQLVDVAGKLPEYRGNIEKKVVMLRGFFGSAAEAVKDLSADLSAATGGSGTAPVKVQNVEQPNNIQFVQYLLGPLLGPLETAGVVLIFVIFMLIEREALRDRLLRLVGQHDLNKTTQALDDVASRISRYLVLQFVVNIAYGLSIAAGLYLIGVPNALAWGALAACMRFIPYIGAWLALVFPLALSIATTQGLQPLYVFLLFLGLELIVPTFIEPLLYGASTGVSALALLVSALFWSLLWGLPGLFLSMPITVCLMVVGRYVPQLKFFDILLNDKQVLETRQRFYQRLLAMNLEEATDVVEEELKKRTLVDIFDSVFLPALALAEIDRHLGRLDERRDTFIRESVVEISDDVSSRMLQSGSGLHLGMPVLVPAQTAVKSVLCLPARHHDDSIAAELAAQLLRAQGLPVQDVMPVLSPRDAEKQVPSSSTADIVCLVALPPGALTHARYLLKRIQLRNPQAKIVVCVWGNKLGVAELRSRLGCAPEDGIATTMAEFCVAVQKLLPIPPVLEEPAAALPAEVPIAVLK